MQLLLTTSHSFLLLDTDSGLSYPLDRSRGLYYGISHHRDKVYVAARGRLVSSDIGQADERGEILVFDRALRPCGKLSAPFPLRDIHEIAWHGGRLWIAGSFDDMIAIYDGVQWAQWFPLGGAEDGPRDVHHFNSFMFDEDRVWILAHKRGASELLAFAQPTLELVERIGLGNCAHNIWREGSEIFTCSSMDGRIVGHRGFSLQTDGFPRAVAFDARTRCVGISAMAERKDRDLSTGKLMIFDQDWRLRKEMCLPGEGLILDMLPLPAGFRPAGQAQSLRSRLAGWLPGLARREPS